MEKAQLSDLDEIMELYYDAMTQEGCTWDAHYPTKKMIADDILRGELYCMKDNNEIIGCFVYDVDEKVDNLPCFSRELTPAREVARLVVKREYQNRGIAREMLTFAMNELVRMGCKSIHFLVCPTNIRAVRSYDKLGFNYVGDVHMFDTDWYCYEKALL